MLFLSSPRKRLKSHIWPFRNARPSRRPANTRDNGPRRQIPNTARRVHASVHERSRASLAPDPRRAPGSSPAKNNKWRKPEPRPQVSPLIALPTPPLPHRHPHPLPTHPPLPLPLSLPLWGPVNPSWPLPNAASPLPRDPGVIVT